MRHEVKDILLLLLGDARRSWHDAAPRSDPRNYRGTWGIWSRTRLSYLCFDALLTISSTNSYTYAPHSSHLRLLRRSPLKIGRKHKAHRQQLNQSKPWRESEKGRKEGRGKGRRFTMGNDESRMVDADTPPQTLTARTVEALAEYIKDGRAKQIVVMVRLPGNTLTYMSLLSSDRRRHKHIRRYTRLSVTRDRPVRQSRKAGPTLRRSRLRHILLSKQPLAVLHTCAGVISRQISTDHNSFLHLLIAQEGSVVEALHAEHRLSRARGWRARRQDHRSTW